MSTRACLAVALGVALAGCEAGTHLTPEQWAALETREIDGRRDDVLRAAAAVVLDEGYFYRSSDHGAGLLSAERVPLDLEDAYRRSGGMNWRLHGSTVVVWVRPGGAGRCELRLQRYAAQHAYEYRQRLGDAEGVTRFAAAVERRMLGGEAAPAVARDGGARREVSP